MGNGETIIEAARRELFEETGISLEGTSQICYVSSIYIRKPHIDYTFHLFRVQLSESTRDVKLSDEHQSYHWATPQDFEKMPLTAGAVERLPAALRGNIFY